MKVCPSCHSRFVGGEAFCPHDGSKLVEARELSPGELTGSELADVVRLDRLIMSDAFAERYTGRLLDSRRSVYVTVFNQHFVPDPEAMKRVETARAKVGSPLPVQINTLLQVHLDKNPVFIVESEPRGPSIRSLLTERKELPWTDAVRLTANLARAAQWLHESGVPHWAFHADSVFVTRLATGTVCVGDWALEAVLPADSVERRLEENPSMFAGYVDYMAPELASGTERADIRSAVYALGCLLYEMVLGRPPLPAQSPTEALKRHKHEKPVRLSIAKGGADLHPELDDILEMMLAKDPEKRFQVPIAVVAALSNLVSESPDELAPPLERAPVEEEDDLYRTINMDSVDREDVLRSSSEASLDEPDKPKPSIPAPNRPVASQAAVSGTSETRADAERDEDDGNLSTSRYKRLEENAPDEDVEDVDEPSKPTLLAGLGNLSKSGERKRVETVQSKKADTLSLGSGASSSASDDLDAGDTGEISEVTETAADLKKTLTNDQFQRVATKSGILKQKKIGKVAEDKDTEANSPDDSLDGDPDEAQLLRRSDISREFEAVEPPEEDDGSSPAAMDDAGEPSPVAEDAAGGPAVFDPDPTEERRGPSDMLRMNPAEAKRAGLRAEAPSDDIPAIKDHTREIDKSEWFSNSSEDAWDEAMARDYAESSEKTNKSIKIGLAILLAILAVGAVAYLEFLYEPEPDATVSTETTAGTTVPAVDLAEIQRAFDDSLTAERIVAPMGNSALHYLEQLKRHGADSEAYEASRMKFVDVARQRAVQADEDGDLRSARSLAGYASQFAPDDEELAAMTADLQARFTGESAPAEAAADAGQADADTPDMGAEPIDEPPAVVEEPKPTKTVAAVTPKTTTPKRTTKTTKKASKRDVSNIADDARAAHTRGNLNQARKLYHDALELDSTSSEVLAGLGKVYFDQANYREAAKFQTRAVRYAPGRDDYRINLGQSFFRLGKYESAIGVWKKVLERDPNNSVALQYIRLAEKKLGK